MQELRDADVAVCVLEPRALRSSWVAFEAGHFHATLDDPNGQRLFPLILTSDAAACAKATEDSPYEGLAWADLSPSGVVGLFSGLVSEAGPQSLSERRLADLAGAALGEIEGAIAARGSAAQLRDAETVATLREVLACDEKFEAIGAGRAQELRSLLSCSTEPQRLADDEETSLARELSQIASLFGECASKENGEFGRLAIQWAMQNLIVDTRERLSSIRGGRLPVRNRALVRDFWLNSVFRRARKSIWTTNVSKPDRSMGIAQDDDLMEAQAKALKRKGFSITRVFVYPTDLAEAEIMLRRDIMLRQLRAGIEVRVIARGIFDTQARQQGAKQRIGGEDFMLIDNRYLYLTFPDEGDIAAELVNNLAFPGQVKAARDFRDIVMSWSRPVTVDTVERFPDALA